MNSVPRSLRGLPLGKVTFGEVVKLVKRVQNNLNRQEINFHWLLGFTARGLEDHGDYEAEDIADRSNLLSRKQLRTAVTVHRCWRDPEELRAVLRLGLSLKQLKPLLHVGWHPELRRRLEEAARAKKLTAAKVRELVRSHLQRIDVIPPSQKRGGRYGM